MIISLKMISDMIEASLRRRGLIEDRVTAKLCVEEGHVAIDTGEDIETSVTLVVVVIVGREVLWASGAGEELNRCHL